MNDVSNNYDFPIRFSSEFYKYYLKYCKKNITSLTDEINILNNSLQEIINIFINNKKYYENEFNLNFDNINERKLLVVSSLLYKGKDKFKAGYIRAYNTTIKKLNYNNNLLNQYNVLIKLHYCDFKILYTLITKTIEDEILRRGKYKIPMFGRFVIKMFHDQKFNYSGHIKYKKMMKEKNLDIPIINKMFYCLDRRAFRPIFIPNPLHGNQNYTWNFTEHHGKREKNAERARNLTPEELVNDKKTMFHQKCAVLSFYHKDYFIDRYAKQLYIK